MGLEWWLACRYLSSKRGRFLRSSMSVLSILGIAIGVATLISVMAVMSGFSSKLLHNILSMNGHVTIHCKGADYHDVVAEVVGTEGVLRVAPVVEGQVLIKSRTGASGAAVRGMETHDVAEKLQQYMVGGDLQALEEGIVMGAGLADALGVSYDDEVTVISSVNLWTILGVTPSTQKLRVVGIFNVGMYEYDGAFAYVSLRNAQTLFGYKCDNVRYLEVELQDAAHSSDVAVNLAKKTGMRVEDWKTQQGQYFYALKLEQDAMFFILVLIVVVAAFNIISGLFVLVHEKMRAIAVMRTMGLSRFAVVRIFCMCGVCIGLIGTLIGCCMGATFVFNAVSIGNFLNAFGRGALIESVAYCLEGISYKMVLFDIGHVAMLSLCISLLSTLPAALKAAGQNPVDVLKYE
ncbi:ABC transporter permease [Candidatus Anaplasma sp. TIGMIC]|uniref:ABC transporter permease n=1 Tax=Candidatus Anaplasma sp. TIGMIC TaxID=3020713 RepID=UPI00232AEEB0|nr:ABC transporter permease [Candidatus Anaplasma sp. TIGMIC]MDB1135626.1 ABC transporter permease [Candidatus Anaplasma sp. TIGMIC]